MNHPELFDEVELNHILEAVSDYRVRLLRMEVNPSGGAEHRRSTAAVLAAVEAKVLRVLDGEPPHTLDDVIHAI